MSLLKLLLSLLLFSHLLLLSPVNSITLSLSRVAPPSTNQSDNLKYHAAASLARAQQLKNAHLRLYPHSYNQYTVNLGFGTPPQNLSLIIDTSSQLVWVPCTRQYICTHCGSSAHTRTFIPESSTSCKNITCQSQQCNWLGPDRQCNNNHSKCGYLIRYGSGSTAGRLLSDKLALPGADDFTVGCSVSSDQVPRPVGIVGFGRGRASLPSQLGLTSFSYCMVSHDLDDNPTASGDLVLSTTSRGGGCKDDPAANYTSFLPNPAAFPDYYYVSLQSISIGGVHVKVPAEYLVPNAQGYGGTIVDASTDYTQLEQSMFNSVFSELVKQVGKKYRRAINVEIMMNLKPCYEVGKNNLTSLPQLAFHFQGNTEMVLPLANSYSYATESVACMNIMSSENADPGAAITLGNYQMQNFYMKYDLENNRLGFRPQKCG